MGFDIGSIGRGISNAAQTVAKTVDTAAKGVGDFIEKAVGGDKQPQPPAKPVDTFEAAPTKPAVCGGNTTSGEQCLPSWGKGSGGGGGKVGVDPG
jgi:hypothetical protein